MALSVSSENRACECWKSAVIKHRQEMRVSKSSDCGKEKTSGGVALSYLQAVALFLNTFLYVHINIQ